MGKILTISIASYNVEKTLDRTLSSLVNKDVLKDLEILIVDDGSKDSTKDVANSYSNMYPDSFHYIKKENGGWGSTVNKSIELATGKFFKLLDGDDWFETNNLVEFINALKNTDADLVLTDYNVVHKDSEDYINYPFEPKKEHPITLLKTLAMHAFTVRTDILKNNNVHLLEKCFYTDAEFNIKVFDLCNNFIYIPLPIYDYGFGIDLNQSVSMQSFIKRKNEYEMVLRTIIEIASKKEKFKDITSQYLTPLVDHYFKICMASDCSKETIKQFINFYDFTKTKSPTIIRKTKARYKLVRCCPLVFYKPLSFLLKKKLKEIN